MLFEIVLNSTFACKGGVGSFTEGKIAMAFLSFFLPSLLLPDEREVFLPLLPWRGFLSHLLNDLLTTGNC